MITQELWMEIQILWKQGMSIRSIAKKLGICRNTVGKSLRNEKVCPSYGPRIAGVSKLNAYKEYLAARAAQAAPHIIPATVLLREIQDLGCTGS